MGKSDPVELWAIWCGRGAVFGPLGGMAVLHMAEVRLLAAFSRSWWR
jgi:hypothetical protein